MALARIKELAADYGIKLVKLNYNETIDRRVKHNLDHKTGFSICQNKVYYPNRGQQQEAVLLHEVAHVICHHSGMPISLTCEAWLQVPYEWCLVKALCLNQRKWKMYLANSTMLGYHGQSWRMIDLRLQKAIMREGILRAERVGILDQNARPTGRWPNWRKLTRQDRCDLRARRVLLNGEVVETRIV
jgi:hypothetical protein